MAALTWDPSHTRAELESLAATITSRTDAPQDDVEYAAGVLHGATLVCRNRALTHALIRAAMRNCHTPGPRFLGLGKALTATGGA